MTTLRILAQALGIAYAAGLDVYATVACTGIMEMLQWGHAPGVLDGLGTPVVIAGAILVYLIEFVVSLRPGMATAWETVHSLIRPPAAAALAAAAAWNGDPGFVLLAALSGGAVAVATHTTKLGVCYVIDRSSRGAAGVFVQVGELALIVLLLGFLWAFPFPTLLLAMTLLVAVLVSFPLIWRVLRQVLSGRWMPRQGLLQHARSSAHAPPPHHEG